MIEKIYKFKGTKEQLEVLDNLFRHIEYLGNIGSSRNLLVRVDGDGSARIKVYDENDNQLNDKKYSIQQDKLYNCAAVYDLD